MGKIIVLGLGPSLNLFTPNGDITIGVNDIWSRVKTDYIVCLDEPVRFTPERLEIINNSTPIGFYTHLDSYSDRPDYKSIELQPYFPIYECLINIPQVPKSLCSPFVACAIAYKYHDAKEIHVYGVDLLNHPHLDLKSCERIKLHFKNLKVALRQNGCEIIIHGDGILKNL